MSVYKVRLLSRQSGQAVMLVRKTVIPINIGTSLFSDLASLEFELSISNTLLYGQTLVIELQTGGNWNSEPLIKQKA